MIQKFNSCENLRFNLMRKPWFLGSFWSSKRNKKVKIRFFSKSSRLTHKTPLYPNKTNATLCNLVYANTNHSKFQEPKLGLRKISMDFRSLFSFQLQKKWFFWIWFLISINSELLKNPVIIKNDLIKFVYLLIFNTTVR